MRQETLQEKLYHDMLPKEFRKSAMVTFGYQDNLRIIQKHLETFYGWRANWSQCIDLYFQSKEYQNFCHTVKHCDDIPIITSDSLYSMIKQDEDYQEKIKEFLQLNQTIKGLSDSSSLDIIYRAAEMLGISPNQDSAGLFSWIISREGLSYKEKQEIHHRISDDIRVFTVLIDLFATLLVPGMQLTFPHIGTAMTQQKTKYFYRGENSFYGFSKPGIFRFSSRRTSVQKIIDKLILDEACFFLDKFDAVQKWSPSSVNYHALAQHYGIKTPLLDITSDLKTALFFACCKYENHKWRPLTQKDFDQKGIGVKDTRYGILYRSPSEITDMKWALENHEVDGKLITPIGYQPFMRCSAQHGYMICVKDETYDLLKDPMFAKFRIEHNEEFCKWIFEEMGCGEKVYPNDDIPKIEDYMENIRNTRMISQGTFENLILKTLGYSKQEAQIIKQKLQKEGMIIIDRQVERIHYQKLQKINKQYNIDVAYSKLDVPTVSRPMIVLPSSTMVEYVDEI